MRISDDGLIEIGQLNVQRTKVIYFPIKTDLTESGVVINRLEKEKEKANEEKEQLKEQNA